MRTRRLLALSGEPIPYLDGLISTLSKRGVSVTDADPDGEPVTTFLIAARFTPEMSWNDWWQRDSDARDAFQAVLPLTRARLRRDPHRLRRHHRPCGAL
jgi:hypothetical protein